MSNNNNIEQLTDLVARNTELRKDVDRVTRELKARCEAEHERLRKYRQKLFRAETSDSVKILKDIFDKLNPDVKITEEYMLYHVDRYVEYLREPRESKHWNVDSKAKIVSFDFKVKNAKKFIFDKSNQKWVNSFPAVNHPLYKQAREHALFYAQMKEESWKHPDLKALRVLMDELEQEPDRENN